MVAGEDVAGAAHVGGELVDLVEALVDDGVAENGVAEVADDELVGGGLAVFVALDVDAADAVALALEALHEVAADESAGPAHQGGLCISHGGHRFLEGNGTAPANYRR